MFKNKLKKLPVGREDFKLLIEKDYYYVDKTSLIEELIMTHDLVNLITRPRRFGKSLNLSMLQYFFEKSEQDNAALFRDLKISGNAEILDEHMGKYPVISLSLFGSKQSLEFPFFNRLFDRWWDRNSRWFSVCESPDTK